MVSLFQIRIFDFLFTMFGVMLEHHLVFRAELEKVVTFYGPLNCLGIGPITEQLSQGVARFALDSIA